MVLLDRRLMDAAKTFAAYSIGSRYQGRKQRLRNSYGTTQTVSRRGKRKSGKTSSFRDILLKNMHAQHRVIDEGTNGRQLLHNTIYAVSPTQAITQGTTGSARSGDSVQLECLKVRGQFLSHTANNWYTYRLIVGFSGEEWNVPSTFLSSLLQDQIFLDTSGDTFVTAAINNPKAFTILDDRTFTINSVISDTREVEAFDYTVPIHQRFDYQDNGATYGKYKNLYVVVMACVGGGTSGVTDAGNVYCGLDMIFKNI